MGRKLCVVLNMPQIPDGLLQSATNTLVFVIAALSNTVAVIDNLVERRIRKGSQPTKKVKLSPENEMVVSAQNTLSTDDEDEDAIDSAASRSSDSADEEEEVDPDSASNNVEGHHWIMQRMRGIGVDSRGNRRLHVLQVCRRTSYVYVIYSNNAFRLFLGSVKINAVRVENGFLHELRQSYY